MRPVSWRKLGQLDMKSLLNLATMEQLVDLHTWDVEQLLRLTYDQCESTGYNIETFTIVIDVAGWTVAQASRDAYTFIKGEVDNCPLEVQS
jgi:CRAL/TRIO domain